MDKNLIIDAYIKGLLSKDECTKILGIDPTIILKENTQKMELQYHKGHK